MTSVSSYNADESAPLSKASAETDPTRGLPSEDREAQLFWQLRTRVAWMRLQQLLTKARLRTSLVAGLSLFFWCGLFMLFFEGFKFLVDHVGPPGATYHAQTVYFVFHLFFASLNVMLVFSSGIILYTALFNSPETEFLLTLPTRPERIVLYKFQEAVFYSSWGFFLLASPMVVAYGIVVSAPWYYYCFMMPLIISFVYIPCAIGAICCLFIVYKMPKLRSIIVGISALVTIGIAARSIWQTASSPQAKLFGSEWFQDTLHRFRFTEQEWLPSSWLTGGVLEAARPPSVVYSMQDVANVPVVQSSMNLALLVTNALLLHVVTVWAAKHWFRASHDRLACRQRWRLPTAPRHGCSSHFPNSFRFSW
jgi:ABC-2 type transport system permease protein